MLTNRQNLILLADKSPYGWKTVLEYKHHDLTDDDEDEKKIYRTKARAVRTSKRFAARGLGYQRRPGLPNQPVSRKSLLAVAQLPGLFTRVSPKSSLNRSAGLCFSCGKPGHWRASYPNVLLSANPTNQQAK